MTAAPPDALVAVGIGDELGTIVPVTAIAVVRTRGLFGFADKVGQ